MNLSRVVQWLTGRYEEPADNMDLFRAIAVLENLQGLLQAKEQAFVDQILHGNPAEARKGLTDAVKEPIVANLESILEPITKKLGDEIQLTSSSSQYGNALRSVRASVVAAKELASELKLSSELSPKANIAGIRLEIINLEEKATLLRDKKKALRFFQWRSKLELGKKLDAVEDDIEILRLEVDNATNPNKSFFQRTKREYEGTIMFPASQEHPYTANSGGLCAGLTADWARQFLRNNEKIWGIYPDKEPPFEPVQGPTALRYPSLNNFVRLNKKISKLQFLLGRDRDGRMFSDLVSAEGQPIYVWKNVRKRFVNTEELGESLIDCVENNPDHVCFLDFDFTNGCAHRTAIRKDKESGEYHAFDPNSCWARFRNSRDLERWLTFLVNKKYVYKGHEIRSYGIKGFSLTPPSFSQRLLNAITTIIYCFSFLRRCLGFTHSQQSAEQVRSNTTSDADEVPDCEEPLLRRVEKIEKTELSNWDAESPAREESPPTNKYAKEDGETSGYKGPSLRSAKRHDDDHEIFGMLDVSKTAIKDAQKRACANLEFTTAKAAPGAASTCSGSFWKQRASCSSSSSSADEADVSCTSTKFVK